MNLNKHIDFFNPSSIGRTPVHIIGCGAIGSNIAEQLVRLGIEKIHLWDFDTVSSHNITNQAYVLDHVGKEKTYALSKILFSINPQLDLRTHGKYEEQAITGYIFLMVDSIETRKRIVDLIKDNPNIKGVFDARMRLTDAQSYGADWTSPEQKEALINSMQFTSEEAQAATPVSACGTSLSVTPTVKMVASVTVTNFMNLVMGNEVKPIILLDAFSYNLNAF